MFWGQHELGWLTFYEFAGRIGVKYAPADIEALEWWLRIGRSCCWWQPRNGVVLMCDRAAQLSLDDRGQLHNESGPAIRFRDGWSVWAINGVQLDERIVLRPSDQTPEQIKREPNVEVKRIRIERFGWDRYLSEIGGQVIDQRENAIENTSEALIRASDGTVVLLPTCKTGRLFALEVPKQITSCEQAQAYLHGGSRIDALIGKTRVIGRT